MHFYWLYANGGGNWSRLIKGRHDTNGPSRLSERSGITRRGVLTAGGAAAVGAAAALATTSKKRRDEDVDGVPDGGLRPDDPACSQLTVPVDTLAASDDERIQVINERNMQAAGNSLDADPVVFGAETRGDRGAACPRIR